eukprot:535218-Amphidinium_carterae.1
MVKQLVDMPVPQKVEEVVQVPMIITQYQDNHNMVEQSVDVLAPQIEEKIVAPLMVNESGRNLSYEHVPLRIVRHPIFPRRIGRLHRIPVPIPFGHCFGVQFLSLRFFFLIAEGINSELVGFPTFAFAGSFESASEQMLASAALLKADCLHFA